MTPEVLTTAAAAKLRPVDPQVWKACAGTETCGPAVGSLVYYFPQGHAEHSASSLDLPSATPCARPTILCRVSAVRLLADSFDEVFLSALLDPVIHAPLPFSSAAAEVVENGEPGGGFIHFAKILTRSDANNGGGFSVPRFCADSIFQPLNYDVGMPAQTLSVRDVHGKSWDFRHIYRGTPKRHLLTTGWSKFVNDKD